MLFKVNPLASVFEHLNEAEQEMIYHLIGLLGTVEKSLSQEQKPSKMYVVDNNEEALAMVAEPEQEYGKLSDT